MNPLLKVCATVIGLASLNGYGWEVSAPRAIAAPPVALVGETAASGSSMPVVSADGRYVAFVSRSPNLVATPTTGAYQIFARDLVNDSTKLISAHGKATAGDDHSLLPSISSNGLWIAFESEASNLAPDDTNGVSDIFVRDVAGWQTLLVARGNRASRNPIISEDGRYVVFESRASNLVSFDSNGAQDVFICDLLLDVTTLVSVNLTGLDSGNRMSELLTMTPDGRFVAFWSDATDISPEATNTTGEVYVRDLRFGVTHCLTEQIQTFGTRRFKVALTPAGHRAVLQELSYSGVAAGGRVFRSDVFSGSINEIYCCGRPGSGLAIGEDGDRMIFPGNDGLYFRELSSTNRLLVSSPPSDLGTALNVGSFHVSRDFQRLWFTMLVTNRGQQLFMYDLAADQMSLVSTNAIGLSINSSIISPFSISDSGTVAAFETVADDLGHNDANRASDIFLADHRLISTRDQALAAATSLGHSRFQPGGVSANGKVISFVSTDSSFFPEDTNGWADAFVVHLSSNLVQKVGAFGTNSAIASSISADGASTLYSRFQGEEFAISTSPPAYLFHEDLRTGRDQMLGTIRGLPSISQDGRWLVRRDATRIVATDLRSANQPNNQFADVSFSGGAPSGESWNPLVSLDGEWVIFTSVANNLTEHSFPSGVPQVFARNLRQQRTRLLSITDTGAPLPGGATNPVLSANARYVVFQSLSGSKVYRHDLLAPGRATNLLVCTGCSRPSISGDGRIISYVKDGQVNLNIDEGWVTETFVGTTQVTDATLSIDGRFVAWVSPTFGISLPPRETRAATISSPAYPQIYLHDRWFHVTHLASSNHLGTGGGNGPSSRPAFSHDSRTLVFESFASDLVPGDYNGRRDIFVVKMSAPDTDEDGMGDDWEHHYFRTDARNGSGDVDGDHLSDAEEFRAGTDPLDPASELRFTAINSRKVPGPIQDTEVKWLSAPGKGYRLQHRPTLALPWTDLPGEIIPGGPTASATHLDSSPGTGFYRVRLLE